ncbi:hypothetical protein ACS0TY_031225 [Phlomoides rotata]
MWKQRNSFLWNGTHEYAVRTVLLAWSPSGFLKLNIDVAFFKDSAETDIDMVLRDDEGVFLAARSLVFSGYLEVDISEAMRFMEALSWVKHLGFENVIVEGDSKVVVDAILSSASSESSFEDFIYVSNGPIDMTE